jgi:hypothetical protein
MKTIMLEELHICEGWKPKTMASGATGAWVDLEGYSGCLIIVHIAQGAVNTTALTVNKAKAIGGTSPSNGITMNNWAKCEDAPLTADTFTKGTAAASITTSGTGSGSSIYLIDIQAADLGDYFTCIQCAAGSSSASNIASCDYLLYGPRNAEAVASMLSGII